MKSKREKLLFRGLFNWGSEVTKKYAWAYSGRQAKVFMLRQIAMDHRVEFNAVLKIFNGEKRNFKICVDPEWMEKRNG